MKIRLGLALLLLFGPAAFAPAPFPRPERARAGDVTLSSFQGRWRVTKIERSRADGRHEPLRLTYTHVRIVRHRWTFLYGDQGEGASFDLTFDDTCKPPLLRFDGNVNGVGLIRRVGGQVQVAYRWGTEENRPVSFERLPDDFWIITLERA
jgi:hypothetical protein